jgi:sec-independent protein translocase protein TatA
MADLGWPEMLIIAIAAMVLFGWKRLPDASRSLGRSIRVFRSEIAGMRTDAEGTDTQGESSAPRAE